MKVLSLILLLSPATALFSSSRSTITDDDALKVPGENPLKYCEDPSAQNHILRIENVDLSPNPPQAGQKLRITASGNFTSQVEEGAYVDINVKLGLIRLLHRKEDLCTQMKEVDKECPLKEGPAEVVKEVDLPSVIPPGTFTVTADVFTKDDEKITCLIAVVNFAKRSSIGADQKQKSIEESIDL